MFRFASRPVSGRLRESELVRILAQRGGVPLYSLEPAYEAEVNGLLRQVEPRLVATYLTLRVFTSEAQGYDGDAALSLPTTILIPTGESASQRHLSGECCRIPRACHCWSRLATPPERSVGSKWYALWWISPRAASAFSRWWGLAT